MRRGSDLEREVERNRVRRRGSWRPSGRLVRTTIGLAVIAALLFLPSPWGYMVLAVAVLAALFAVLSLGLRFRSPTPRPTHLTGADVERWRRTRHHPRGGDQPISGDEMLQLHEALDGDGDFRSWFGDDRPEQWSGGSDSGA
jgi:hypothetical protein